jgi:hypothetical protein
MSRPARFALAAFAATLSLFLWGAFSHTVLINGIGFAALPEEPSFLDAVRPIPPGLYAFPAPPAWHGNPSTDQAMAAFDTSFRDGPSGLLIVRPRGEPPVSLKKLLTQLAANTIAVLIALFVLSQVSGSWWRRWATVTVVGATGLVSVGIITWNWYAFTDAFYAALCLDVIGGWMIVGAVLSSLAPRLERSALASSAN